MAFKIIKGMLLGRRKGVVEGDGVEDDWEVPGY